MSINGLCRLKTVSQKMKVSGAARRKKIEARAAGLIAEEITSQKVRQTRKLS